jgi:hypothetical protein
LGDVAYTKVSAAWVLVVEAVQARDHWFGLMGPMVSSTGKSFIVCGLDNIQILFRNRESLQAGSLSDALGKSDFAETIQLLRQEGAQHHF